MPGLNKRFVFLFLVAVLLFAARASWAASYDLFVAISQNNFPAVQRLAPSGAALNRVDRASGATPLTWACMKGINPEIADLLISRGADIEKMDGEGETPLTTTAVYGNPEVARLLLRKGADPNHPNNQGHPPVVLASGQNGRLEIVKMLVEQGKVQVQGEMGILALKNARAFKKPDIAQYLKSRGARPGYFQALNRLFPPNPARPVR